MKPIKYTPYRARLAVADWNRRYKVGQHVAVTHDGGYVQEYHTRSEAFILSNNIPVIFLVGVTGCYSLDRVKAVETEVSHHT